MEGKYDLFLSYARGDDEPFVQRLYRDLTARGYKVWWDRECMPSRALTFLQEIRDAIEASDRLLAVFGPRAVQSDYVISEWQHALLFAKGVVPVMRLGERQLLPPELRKLHCPDFRTKWWGFWSYRKAFRELLRILREPMHKLGPLRTRIPALPPHFLLRQEDLNRMRDMVLADVQRPTVVTSAHQTTGMWGMGGIGKTVLAAALTRTTDTRRAFLDGVLWLTVGQEANSLQQLRRVGMAFEDEPQFYLELDSAQDRLPRLLADKVCLIVLDDVWQVEYVEPLVNALGPRCRLLITTRDAGLVAALGAQELPLEVLSDAAAGKLLAGWVDLGVDDLPAEAREVAHECGNLPLALSLCGSLARDGISWSDLRDALKEADLTYIEKKLPNYPHRNVFKALQVSIDSLEHENSVWAEHYRELAVFPADEAIPEAAVVTLWQQADGLKEREARKLLAALDRKALLKLQGQEPDRQVTLHDLQYDYLRALAGEDLYSLHQRLLAAYGKKCTHGWPTGPNDGYFFERLADHLVAAGRQEDLRRLLLSFDWLKAKLAATDVTSLRQDYLFLKEDEALQAVQGALQLAAQVLSGGDPGQLPSQLTGRLLGRESPSIANLLQGIRERQPDPWLRPLTPNLTPPGGPLLANLRGHEGGVRAVAVTPDGRRAVSGSEDKTLKVWDLETGEELRTLRGHEAWVQAVALSPDGRRAVSGSEDRTLKVWDLEMGEELATLRGHKDDVNAVALTPDGRRAVSGSDDQTLKVWDLERGEELHTLRGHEDWVRAVALSPDGRRAVSGSADQTLKVWDLERGEELATFTGESAMKACAVSADGRTIVAGDKSGQVHFLRLEGV
jgi:WD40 repeat protein